MPKLLDRPAGLSLMAIAIVGAAVQHSAALASPSTRSSELSAEVRLGTIGYRLATANSSRCARPQMMTGLILHELGAYPARDRAAVTAHLGLTYGFGIRAIIPGSAAVRSELREGDEIMAVNGQDLRSFGAYFIGADASYDRTEKFYDLLDGALRPGPAKFTVKRQGTILQIPLQGEAGCGGRVALMQEDALHAWSDGHYVGVTTRMMNDIQDDQELAFVIGHEMAHNILGHADMKGLNSPLLQFGIGGGKIKATELEADARSIHLMAAAGYDPRAALRYFDRIKRVRPIRLATTHPFPSRRMAMVEAEIVKLEQRLP